LTGIDGYRIDADTITGSVTILNLDAPLKSRRASMRGSMRRSMEVCDR
jgi:hypothetical protein